MSEGVEVEYFVVYFFGDIPADPMIVFHREIIGEEVFRGPGEIDFGSCIEVGGVRSAFADADPGNSFWLPFVDIFIGGFEDGVHDFLGVTLFDLVAIFDSGVGVSEADVDTSEIVIIIFKADIVAVSSRALFLAGWDIELVEVFIGPFAGGLIPGNIIFIEDFQEFFTFGIFSEVHISSPESQIGVVRVFCHGFVVVERFVAARFPGAIVSVLVRDHSGIFVLLGDLGHSFGGRSRQIV